MSYGAEQLSPSGKIIKWRPGIRRWYKRQTTKIWRRLARQHIDDAPVRRPTRGWAD